MLLSTLIAALTAGTLYVSDNGSDANSGRSSTDAFRTLARVQQELRKGGYDRVQLRGTFYLDQTLELGPEANGVMFAGPATISGARKITGWRKDSFSGRSVWSAKVPEGHYFKQLFVGPDDTRAPRTRLPDAGLYQFEALTNGAEKAEWNKGQGEAIFRAGDLRQWPNLEDVEVIATHFWVDSHLPLKEIDPARRLVKFQNPSVFRLTEEHTGRAAPYWIENVPELKKPGQWYLDRRDWKVYYWPRSEDRLESFVAHAPVVATLLRVRGAENVTLSDLSFRHSEYPLPKGFPGDVQAAYTVPGAIQIVESKNCGVERSSIEAVGGYAVEVLGSGSMSNEVRRCTMRDLGAGGVKLGHDSSKTTIADNVIERGGRIYLSAVGVWVGNSGGNLISHNLIRDLYYTGISVGWSWGYGPSKATQNVIEFNDISQIGQGKLSDMGGIYTLGVSPGTVIRNNYIHDVEAKGYGGWGIYLDEGSTGIVVENNVVHDTKTGGFHQHYGKDNLIRNNIFAFARTQAQVISSRAEQHNSFTFERNIVVWNGDAELFGGGHGEHTATYRNNIFWRTDGKPVTGLGKPVHQIGRDNRSLDPRLIDVRKRDFRLRTDSPALDIGFRQIDLSQVGPRR